MPELFKFTTAEQVQSFVKEVLALKELIKCPVCLDSTKNPVRISCDHVYCSECLDTFVNTFKDQAPNKIPQCPICRKPVNRQRKSVNLYVESALKFIDEATTQVQAAFGCDISLLINVRNIEDALKTKNDNNTNLRTSRRLSTDSSNIIQPTEDQDKRIDVFDKLMNVAAKSKNVKKKYARKIKNASTDKNKVNDENKVVIFDTIKSFENEESRESIVQWLHDTKNNFERKTQTQDFLVDDENVTEISFDVPSVSQDPAPRIAEDPKKRPRSLEVTVTKPSVKVKRHSFSGQSEEIKKIDIEDDSDEKNKDKAEVCVEKAKRRKGKGKLKKGKGNNEGGLKNKTGWGRIEKINKTINRNTRQTKMLPVSLTCSTPRDKDMTSVNPVVILTKFQEVECFEKRGSEVKKSIKMNVNIELENDIIELTDNSLNKQENQKQNVDENFVCLTNKAWENSAKLLSGNIFSDDEDEPVGSVQCSKPEQNATRKTVNFKTPEKIEISGTLVEDAASTIEELRSFLNASNAPKVKSCVTKLKLIFDHLNKMNNKSQNSSLNKEKSLVSTQTVNFEDMKSVYVQTDTPPDSGFKISSAEAFKTREYFEKEVQTEEYNCPNCQEKNGTIPKTKDKYEFTQSFDNIDFDTQKLVDKSKINFSQISTQEIPTQRQKNTDKNTNTPEENNNPSQIKSTSEAARSCLEISLSNRSKINEMVKLKESVSDALKTYKRIRTLDSDESGNESICKKKRLENKYLADNLSIEMLSEDVLEDDGEALKATDGSLSLDKCEEVDYDAYLNNIMKKYDDKATTNQEQNKRILAEPKPSTSKKTESQNVLERCEAMIRNAETKKLTDPIDTDHPKKIQQIPNNKDNREIIETEGDEEEDIPEIVRESPIDVAFEDEFNEPFEELPKSAVFKLSTESFMANMNIDNLPVTKIDKSALNIMDVVEDGPTISNVEALIDEYGRDFCGTNCEEKSTMGSKVTVLQNIIVTPKHRKYGRMNSERSEELFNSDMEEDVIEDTPKRKKVVERRLFSQSKPPSQRNILHPLPPLEDSPDIISLTNPTAFLNQTFAPPTEFQDFDNIETNPGINQPPIADPDDLDVTMVPAQPTTPNRKNTQNQRETKEPDNNTEFLSLTESEMMRFMSNEEKNVITSTQRSRVITSTQKTHAENIEKIIGVSPIRFERKRLNPIDVAKQSKFSPLDVVAIKSQTPQKILTPAHSKQKSILSFMRQESRNNSLDDSVCSTGSADLMPAPMKVTKPCISCTRLNKEQILAIMALTKRKLATYSNSFGANVTHMVVSVNENNCIFDHTMKYLMAVATGKWVVSFEWIRECLSQNKIVPEAAYEALDVSSLPGPCNSRIYGKRMPLFLGYKIHLVPPFTSAAKEEIEQLITFMGGELVPKLEMIAKLSGIRIIVMEAKSTQDYFECEKWLETYRLITVDVEWLTRTIGQFKVLSLRSFALCTDENFESLGYPPELVAETQSMHTQSTGATK